MAITSKGYAGTVNYADWAVLASRMGSEYGVIGNNDAFMAGVGVGDRAVTVAAGEAVGHGIRDVSDATVTVTGASVTSGDRWDLIALRRDWEAEESTIVLIQGTSAKAVPERNTAPGVTVDDQPLWLVKFSAGQTAVQDFVDLRVWWGDGGMVARDLMVRDYLNRVGTRVSINGQVWTLDFNMSGLPVWSLYAPEIAAEKVTSGVLPIERGGTGAGTPVDARKAVGIQSGVRTVAATGVTAVTFPTPFATPPVVTVSVVLSAGGVVSVPWLGAAPTTTGFNVRIFTYTGAQISGQIHWTAVAQ